MSQPTARGESEQQRLSMVPKRGRPNTPGTTRSPLSVGKSRAELEVSKLTVGREDAHRPPSTESLVASNPIPATGRKEQSARQPHVPAAPVTSESPGTYLLPKVQQRDGTTPPPLPLNVHKVPQAPQQPSRGPLMVDEAAAETNEEFGKRSEEPVRSFVGTADEVKINEPAEGSKGSPPAEIPCSEPSKDEEERELDISSLDAICQQVRELPSDGDRADVAFMLYTQHLKHYERKPSFTADTWDEIKCTGRSESWFGAQYNRERDAFYFTLCGRTYRVFIFSFVLRLVCLVLLWAIMFLLASRAQFSPGGLYFDTAAAVLFSGVVGSVLSRMTGIPSVACVVLAGVVYNNIPPTGNLTSGISGDMKKAVALFGLTVGMIRGGLALNLCALKANYFRYLGFSILPMVAEAVAHGFLARALFDYPTPMWALLHGFIVTANAPAVIIPVLIELQQKGYGTRGGPGMMLLISVSVEATLCVWVIQLCLAVQFNTMGPLLAGLLGPIQIIVGLVIGIALGYALYFVVFNILCKEGERLLLHRSSVLYATQRHSSHIRLTSFLIIVLVSLVCTSVGAMVSCVGGAAVVTVTMLALFAYWCDAGGELEHLTAKGDLLVFFRVLWDYVGMPSLFGLAGAAVDMSDVLGGGFIGFGIICVLTGLVVRFLFSALTPLLLRMPFTWKELVFCGIGSLGKGPMQAAFGSMPLLLLEKTAPNNDNATQVPDDSQVAVDMRCARTLKNSAVLSMLAACLVCSVLLKALSQKLLRRDAVTAPAAAR